LFYVDLPVDTKVTSELSHNHC